MDEAFSLSIERVIPGAIEKVFDAWLDPLVLRKWMIPMEDGSAEASTDPVVGGAFRIVMKRGQTMIPHEGVYRVIERPRKLAFTWNSPYSRDTLVTVEFESLAVAITRVRLTHERFPDRGAMESHRGGWGDILSALERQMAATVQGGGNVG